MALVTVNAVVDVSRHFLVLEVVRIVIPVASRALEYGIVIRIDMARRADVVRVAMTRRELRVLLMVKRRVVPVRCVVAVLASRREELRLCLMSRIRRVVVIGRMAAVAVCRQSRVVVVDVAIHAMPWRCLMRTSERESSVVVIERRICPIQRVMAKLAGRREPCGCVRWVIRVLIIRLVACVTECAIQVVVVVLVAIRALPWWHSMGIRQLETRTRVIERAIRPLHRVMTGFAGSREIRGNVVHRC